MQYRSRLRDGAQAPQLKHKVEIDVVLRNGRHLNHLQ
jgi:hypothetical protein